MSQERRIERDTLGEVEVPASAYYGAQTARARDNFEVSGIRMPRGIIRALGMLKGAAASVNAARGALDPQVADVIGRAAAEVAGGALDAQFVVDVFQTGSGTSTNMNANEVIANRAAELLGQPLGAKLVHPNDHVNMAQSSNDVFPTAVHLALLLALQERLLPEMARLAAALDARADRWFDRIKTGRTHLMDAMPIRYGQEFRGYAAQVAHGRARIAAAGEELRAVALGGTAVGTGVNAPPDFAARVCEAIERAHAVRLRETAEHFSAQSSLDAVVHASGAMRGFATAFYKIANDVRWMASGPSCGLGELTVPVVQPGSSIMPGKTNPVICESAMMLCAQVLAYDFAIAFGNSQGQFELNTMMPLLAHNALASAELLANGCRMFRTRCIDGLELTEQGAALVRTNPMLATALGPVVGYDVAAAVAAAAAATGRAVRDVAAAMTGLPPARLDELLDPAVLAGQRGAPSRPARASDAPAP